MVPSKESAVAVTSKKEVKQKKKKKNPFSKLFHFHHHHHAHAHSSQNPKKTTFSLENANKNQPADDNSHANDTNDDSLRRGRLARVSSLDAEDEAGCIEKGVTLIKDSLSSCLSTSNLLILAAFLGVFCLGLSTLLLACEMAAVDPVVASVYPLRSICPLPAWSDALDVKTLASFDSLDQPS
eukprot:m.306558 g.306558  ORF g.306558 m.306558 type:complete len:182 (+) comp41349_c0_seq1:140-685(+)